MKIFLLIYGAIFIAMACNIMIIIAINSERQLRKRKIFLKADIEFKWYDIWIGMYIDTDNYTVYLCMIPTIVFKFEWN